MELKATFLKINDIDTLSQQFEAEIYVQAKWEEIALVGMKEKVGFAGWPVRSVWVTHASVWGEKRLFVCLSVCPVCRPARCFLNVGHTVQTFQMNSSIAVIIILIVDL